MFKDRFDAGRKLAERLKAYGEKNTIVLAIPRGGLQVGAPIAKALHCPLDVIVAKKIPYPDQPELALGAIGEGGEVVINEEIMRSNLEAYVEEKKKYLLIEVQRKAAHYHAKAPKLSGKTVILTDDGIATGSTMLACIEVVKKQDPKAIIVALPIGSHEGIAALKRVVDKVICLEIPDLFFAVGQGYESFEQVEDNEAIRILKEANEGIKKAIGA